MYRLSAALFFAVTASMAIAAPPARDAAEKSADADDKIVCKRFIETGSLVKGYRTCKSKRDWERERDEQRRVTQSQSCQFSGGASCG